MLRHMQAAGVCTYMAPECSINLFMGSPAAPYPLRRLLTVIAGCLSHL